MNDNAIATVASNASGYTLPERPLLTIAPSRGWVTLNLAEFWAHRELLYFLTWRDIKIRYKQIGRAHV